MKICVRQEEGGEAEAAEKQQQIVEATGKKPRTVEGALRDLDAIAERAGGSHGHNVYRLAESIDSQSVSLQLAVDEDMC